jgi:hypothetical protein
LYWRIDVVTHIKAYKPEVTNPQHTEVEIVKGKVKRKRLHQNYNLRTESTDTNVDINSGVRVSKVCTVTTKKNI